MAPKQTTERGMEGTYQQFREGSRARDKAGGKGEKEKR
jgi:hypothetical protein